MVGSKLGVYSHEYARAATRTKKKGSTWSTKQMKPLSLSSLRLRAHTTCYICTLDGYIRIDGGGGGATSGTSLSAIFPIFSAK
jgi:hypothetical protein